MGAGGAPTLSPGRCRRPRMAPLEAAKRCTPSSDTTPLVEGSPDRQGVPRRPRHGRIAGTPMVAAASGARSASASGCRSAASRVQVSREVAARSQSRRPARQYRRGGLAFLHYPWRASGASGRRRRRASDLRHRGGRRSLRLRACAGRCSAGRRRAIYALANSVDHDRVATPTAPLDRARRALVDRAGRRKRSMRISSRRDRVTTAARIRAVGRTVVLQLRFDDFSRAASHTLQHSTAQTQIVPPRRWPPRAPDDRTARPHVDRGRNHQPRRRPPIQLCLPLERGGALLDGALGEIKQIRFVAVIRATLLGHDQLTMRCFPTDHA